nr:MAG TPA: hypothetical protein [Caudoviricetes sp.]
MAAIIMIVVLVLSGCFFIPNVQKQLLLLYTSGLNLFMLVKLCFKKSPKILVFI